MRPNRWARRGSAAGFAALLLAGACSPAPAVMVAAVDKPSAHPVRDFDLTLRSTVPPPTSAPAVTAMFQGKPSRASRSTVRPRPTPLATSAAVTAATAPPPVLPVVDDGWGLTALQRRIGGCESSGRPDGPLVWTAQNRHSTASGAFQYLDTTWNGYGGYAKARLAPPAVQVERFKADSAHSTAPWASSQSCWA